MVCSGGGGIPTIWRDGEGYSGVEAVIDKDLSAALLAEQVGADALVIATDVEAVTRFAERTGRTVVITSLPQIEGAVAGATGTRVVPVRPDRTTSS